MQEHPDDAQSLNTEIELLKEVIHSVDAKTFQHAKNLMQMQVGQLMGKLEAYHVNDNEDE